ncbi:MAG: iron ABC transporter permease [Oscillospiraceae bacterium]|nr:iron ABC transporter permease [Oscillospiraceae bacterium]
MKRKSFPYSLTLAGLWVLLLGSILVSVCLGRYPMSLKELGGILLGQIVPIEPFWSPVQEALFLQHRLPRVLLAVMVGLCLSGAGASYQGVFRNPMAAPDLLGASGGAAFGAALAIVLGLGQSMILCLAFACSLGAVFLVILVGQKARGKGVMGLILGGIMISSLLSSGTSFLKLVADPEDQLPAITYWLMGSFNGSSTKDVLLALVPMVLGVVPLLLLRWRINLLTLGDEEAHSLGIHPGRLRLVVILCASLITAASVAVSGVIGWVGLVVPHLARRMVGDNYKRLLPCSMLFGGSFLLLVDDISRNLLATEIPIGILTGFLGAPLFLYLITKDGDRSCRSK